MMEHTPPEITVTSLLDRLNAIPLISDEDEVLVARREELRVLLSNVLNMFGPSLDGEEAGVFIKAIDDLEQKVGAQEAE